MRLALAALVAVAGLVFAAGEASTQPDAAESADLGMPFDGRWANEFGTTPDRHARRSDQNWTMDVFAPDTPVAVRVGNATGEVEIEVDRVELDTTCQSTAGEYVQVIVRVDGTDVGVVLYHHLVDVQVSEGDRLDNGAVLGRTVSNPTDLFGTCWRVTTPLGIHTHLAITNADGHACYVPHDVGEALVAGTTIGRMGFDANGASVGSAPRDECGSAPPPPPPVMCGKHEATIVGTDGDDLLIGTPGRDVIAAGSGNDRIFAGDGDDFVCAGPGHDVVYLELGNDIVKGEEGDDVLFGGEGADTLIGDAGDDVIDGGPGNDLLVGRGGADRLRGRRGADTLRGQGGLDNLGGGQGRDTMHGDADDDFLAGGRGPDLVVGGTGIDDCTGGRGDDVTAECEP
ncbi:MAG: hypothetical protein HKN26_13690 [Acidimicrobiales bacterium]|nr:hypothetical protein [Acidimicrobiales bacterium]